MLATACRIGLGMRGGCKGQTQEWYPEWYPRKGRTAARHGLFVDAFLPNNGSGCEFQPENGSVAGLPPVEKLQDSMSSRRAEVAAKVGLTTERALVWLPEGDEKLTPNSPGAALPGRRLDVRKKLDRPLTCMKSVLSNDLICK